MKLHYPILIFTHALILAWILTPLLRKLALKIKLVDHPNSRKVHKEPVPLIGGIVLFFSTILTLYITGESNSFTKEFMVLIIGSFILLIVGVIDDKMNLRASLKLIIQIALAYFVFESGIRIESLHGILGVYELPLYLQYLMTISVITGVVNAFNLMDGIDGLAGGLAILGLMVFIIIAFWIQNFILLTFFVALIGALIALLRFNFSTKQKIFMGDAGSLFLGFVLITSGIYMIQGAQNTPHLNLTLALVMGVLALPVIDSLRVYRRRMKNGHSPFKADRTHFHHLVIFLGAKHKKSSLMILSFAFVLIVISALLSKVISITLLIIILLLVFIFTTTLISFFNTIFLWRTKIKKLEEL